MADQCKNIRQQGFSLLDVTVGLTLLTVGLVPMAGVLTTASNFRQDMEIRYKIHQVAASRLEALKMESTSIQGYMNQYTLGVQSSSVNSPALTKLPVTEVVQVVEIVPTNLGVARSAQLSVTINYVDNLNQNRQLEVSTFVNKDLP